MKYHDNGCFYSVTVSRREVEAFKHRRPCSGLPDRWLWFQFDKRNDDIVDMQPLNLDRVDGLDALLSDARAYGKKQIARLTKRASDSATPATSTRD